MTEEHRGVVVEEGGVPTEFLAMMVNSSPGFKVSLFVGELMAIVHAIEEADDPPEKVIREYAEAVAPSPRQRDIFIEMMVAAYEATDGMLDDLMEEAREARGQREEESQKAQIASDWHVNGSEGLADRGSPFG